jgi:hypothetical protein
MSDKSLDPTKNVSPDKPSGERLNSSNVVECNDCAIRAKKIKRLKDEVRILRRIIKEKDECIDKLKNTEEAPKNIIDVSASIGKYTIIYYIN